MLDWPEFEVWCDSLEDAGVETLGLRLGLFVGHGWLKGGMASGIARYAGDGYDDYGYDDYGSEYYAAGNSRAWMISEADNEGGGGTEGWGNYWVNHIGNGWQYPEVRYY